MISGIVVVSPETDLACKGESYSTRRWKNGCKDTCDPIYTGNDPGAESMDEIYQLLGKPGEPGSYNVTDPSLSVLYADLHGLPPTLIHVGDAEVMLSDSVDFGKKARAANSPVKVKVWSRMWHVFTSYSEGCQAKGAEPLEEAIQAIAEQGAFLKSLARQHNAGFSWDKPLMVGISVLLCCWYYCSADVLVKARVKK